MFSILSVHFYPMDIYSLMSLGDSLTSLEVGDTVSYAVSYNIFHGELKAFFRVVFFYFVWNIICAYGA